MVIPPFKVWGKTNFAISSTAHKGGGARGRRASVSSQPVFVAMPPSIQPIGKSAIKSAIKNAKDADFVIAWLEERADEALFVGNASKAANGKPRLLMVTKYRIATFGFRTMQSVKFYEFELLRLLAVQVERDEGTWMFDGNVGVNVKSKELQQAVRTTLHAHGMISLCLDRRPSLKLQLPSGWPSMAVDLFGSVPDMGFSKAWLAHTSYAHGMSAVSGAAATALAQHRKRLGTRMEQVIGRPVERDRVLDLSFCTELTSADFHAVALTLKDTSMFSGLRVRPCDAAIAATPSPHRIAKRPPPPPPPPLPPSAPPPHARAARARVLLMHTHALLAAAVAGARPAAQRRNRCPVRLRQDLRDPRAPHALWRAARRVQTRGTALARRRAGRGRQGDEPPAAARRARSLTLCAARLSSLQRHHDTRLTTTHAYSPPCPPPPHPPPMHVDRPQATWLSGACSRSPRSSVRCAMASDGST